MGFLQTLTGESRPVSPAERIHLIYKNNTDDKSGLVHWQRLVRARGVEDCELLLRHFLSSEVVNPPRIALVTVANVDSYLAEARNNPEATQFPVSRKAAELAERINTTEPETIPAEHVALSMYRYEALAKATLQYNRDLWYRLPPASMFVLDWFGSMATYGKLRDRLFGFRAKPFTKWWYSQCTAIGEHNGEKITDYANTLLLKSPEPTDIIG